MSVMKTDDKSNICACCHVKAAELNISHARNGLLVCLRCHLNEGLCCHAKQQ